MYKAHWLPANKTIHSAGNEGLKGESKKFRKEITMALSFQGRAPRWTGGDEFQAEEIEYTMTQRVKNVCFEGIANGLV